MRPKSQRGVCVAALVAAVACSAVLLAQAPAQDPAAPGPTVGQIRSGTPQPVFRAGVTLVTTDVIVRDRDGVFLPDLTRDEFRVFEDGVEQEIASLVLVHGGRVYNQFMPPPPVQEGIILPASRPPNDLAGRIFILFVDDLHLTTTKTPKIRQIFKEIADTLIHEGDLFGIISTGPSSIAIDMTYDRNRLYEAMGRITGDALTIRDQVELQDTSRGPAEVLYRAHVSFKTARDVLKNLEEVTDRRKVFIYLSNGWDFNPFPESRLYNGFENSSLRDGQARLNSGQISQDEFDQLYSDFPDPLTDPLAVLQRQGQQFADSDLSIQLAELARVANRANTSFYTFDPRGLVAAPDINENIPIEEWQTHIFKTQNSLRMLSELTGGMAVVNRNDYGDALRQIDAETSDYYVVGFYTSNPDPTIRTRRLRVEIPGREDDDLDIKSRTHYTLPRGPA
jgi:VWFA-related protein